MPGNHYFVVAPTVNYAFCVVMQTAANYVLPVAYFHRVAPTVRSSCPERRLKLIGGWLSSYKSNVSQALHAMHAFVHAHIRVRIREIRAVEI